MNTVFGIDIETTGLNPLTDRVVTVGLQGEPGVAEAFDEPHDERKLLWKVAEQLTSRGSYGDFLVGWNHTEFDLPFLAVRYALWGIGNMGPLITPIKQMGKYGNPRYNGSWHHFWYSDIAYQYEEIAKDLKVKWSLKPVAKALGLSIPDLEVDFEREIVDGIEPCAHPRDFGGTEHEFDVRYRKFNILDLSTEERKEHCLSDVDLTMALYRKLSETIEVRVKGQAVLNEGFTQL